MTININYHTYTNFLSKEEWTLIIENHLKCIKHTHIGNILINQLNFYILMGHTITIINYNNMKSFQYPSMNYKLNGTHFNITICIPDTPYFIKVPVLSSELTELVNDDQNLQNIYNCNESNIKLDNEFVKSFSNLEFQPVVVMLFHELVHSLRLLEGVFNNGMEEEATIYGITSYTLKINEYCVTENTFRKELKLAPRISHDSEYLYVYNTLNTITKPILFWKETFSKIHINL